MGRDISEEIIKSSIVFVCYAFSLTSCNGMHNRLYSNDQSIADDTMNDIIKYVNDEDINLYLKCFLKKL